MAARASTCAASWMPWPPMPVSTSSRSTARRVPFPLMAGAEQSGDGRLGPMGDEVVFENDRVRIWELTLPPGADSNVHQHELDYILVILGGDRVAAVQEPDSASSLPPYFEAAVIPNTTVFVERGGIEIARNVGAEPYHEFIIELKD